MVWPQIHLPTILLVVGIYFIVGYLPLVIGLGIWLLKRASIFLCIILILAPIALWLLVFEVVRDAARPQQEQIGTEEIKDRSFGSVFGDRWRRS